MRARGLKVSAARMQCKQSDSEREWKRERDKEGEVNTRETATGVAPRLSLVSEQWAQN